MSTRRGGATDPPYRGAIRDETVEEPSFADNTSGRAGVNAKFTVVATGILGNFTAKFNLRRFLSVTAGGRVATSSGHSRRSGIRCQHVTEVGRNQ